MNSEYEEHDSRVFTRRNTLVLAAGGLLLFVMIVSASAATVMAVYGLTAPAPQTSRVRVHRDFDFCDAEFMGWRYDEGAKACLEVSHSGCGMGPGMYETVALCEDAAPAPIPDRPRGLSLNAVP